MTTTSTPEFQWSISDIWNDSVNTFDQRILEPRDRIYASEILTPYVDRYLKMKATKYSNPANERSLRKFDAGDCWEFIVGFVLQRAGIRQECQAKLKHQLPGCLVVSGKLDYTAGGKPDWDLARSEVNKLGLPERVHYKSQQIIEKLQKMYGNNYLEVNCCEIKSCSSYVSKKLEATGRPLDHHAAQNFFYSMAYNKPGKLFYVCKDDSFLYEFRIEPDDPERMLLYKNDVEEMSYYYQKKKRPPIEEEMKFYPDTFTFRHNFWVEYSPYLSLLYGYKSPMEYREKYKRLCDQFNRVFKRCVQGDKMTPANLDIIKEAKKKFKKWDELVHLAVIQKAKLEQTEDEEVLV